MEGARGGEEDDDVTLKMKAWLVCVGVGLLSSTSGLVKNRRSDNF